MDQQPAIDELSLTFEEDFPEIRESVRRICEHFPGAYWRELEARSAYPDDFVAALTGAGHLAALIPQEYGGAGLPLRAAAVILETIHAAGCNAGACHAQMYIMGTLLRHGSPEQKRKYLPGIVAGELRLRAFGVTEPTTGTDTTQLKTRAPRDGDFYRIHGQKVRTSRALHSDLTLLHALVHQDRGRIRGRADRLQAADRAESGRAVPDRARVRRQAHSRFAPVVPSCPDKDPAT